MIELILAGASSGLVAAVVGYAVGRRGREGIEDAASERADRRLASLDAGHRAVVRRVEAEREELRDELDRTRARFRKAVMLPAVEPVRPARLTPNALQPIVERVSNLMFVDEALIAGPDGLTRTRPATNSQTEVDLAALGAPLGRLQSAVAVEMWTTEARCVAARALPSWTEGSWLLVGTTNGPAASAALDAAVAYAEMISPNESAGPTALVGGAIGTFHAADRGPAVARLLAAELPSTDLSALVLVEGGSVVGGARREGALSDVERSIPAALRFREQATRALHVSSLTSVEIVDDTGQRLTVAPMGQDAFVVMASTRAIGRALADRLVGLVRHALSGATARAA